ncbi:MAG TPA: MBL fold metallo-hydrolase [Dehalococcoidia bacterium]|nr:MBL fold metallo-hydrolase [Dehalococcoidia bacterium]
MAALELTLLGTGGPLHQPLRYGNSQLISAGGTNLMVDAGWGATIRLSQSSVPLTGVDHVLVTHLHSDHTTDFADLLVMRWVTGATTPLKVYGPEGTTRMIAGYRQALEADTKYRFAHHGEKLAPMSTECDVTEIEAGVEPLVIAEIGGITVKAFEVDHRPVMPAFGFRFEHDGKSIVISGDTIDCPGLRNGAQGAGIMVADSMNKRMMTALQERLKAIGNLNGALNLQDAQEYHTDVLDAAKIAEDCGVKHLVLSHILPPVPDDQAPIFTQGMDAIYHGKVSMGSDLARYVAE